MTRVEMEIMQARSAEIDAPFRALIEQSADGVIVLRPNGMICFSNPAAQEMLGFNERQLNGELFGIPVVPGGKAEVNLLLNGVPSRVAEIRVVDIEWEDEPALLATLRDITQMKAAVEAAELAVRRRDQFLAMLSHELRNPLGAIKSALHLMIRAKRDPSVVTKSQRVVSRQVEQMSRLIDDLLDVSRVTQGKIALRRHTISICHVVRDAVETVRSSIEDRRQHLMLDAADDTLRVNGDASRLQQIVVNLLTNAVKYTPPGGCIIVGVERVDNEAVIQVQDSGKGIPAALLDSIFDMFVQADDTLDRSHGGLGVGLTLVRALVSMHGGKVTARSEGPGRGSVFEVRLPLTICDRPEIPLEPTATNSQNSRRILVVDDNADCREMLRMLLELDGHQVSTADDGFMALESIRRIQPDVALVDIGLPGIDGYQVARQVRQDTSLDDVCLVALTGYGQPSDRETALEAGFDAHLVKPFDPAALSQILSERCPCEGE
jgi:two-component system CheB/CheR fusion protein